MSVYTYATLDNPSEASTTQPLGINDAGQVVGIFDLPIIFSTYYGFLYSGGSYTTLSDPSSTAPNGSGTFAYSINCIQHQRLWSDCRVLSGPHRQQRGVSLQWRHLDHHRRSSCHHLH